MMMMMMMMVKVTVLLSSHQDVFTVSVGNIPPGATVLIKITYVAELPVEDENILFNLPGSLAPWSRDQALKDSTQVMKMW
jgi:poly [ADP-ribose] polymerase